MAITIEEGQGTSRGMNNWRLVCWQRFEVLDVLGSL